MQKREYVLAIELGGSHATCGVAHREGILASKTIAVPAAAVLRPLLPEFREILHEMLANHNIALTQCAGLALAFCGLVDTKRNCVWSTGGKYEDAVDLDLEAWCRQEFGLPFQIENDARLALLGEWTGGAAHGENNVVMITLGTGFGTAAIMEGKLVRGKYSLAAARGGHFSITLAGTPCLCGNLGCVETEASTWALAELSGRLPFRGSGVDTGRTYSDFRSLAAGCRTGDSGAIALWDHCLRVWAAATVTMVHAYDADMVVIGGGVMRGVPAILEPLAKYIGDHAWTPWGRVDVRAASLGEHAALLGATALFDLDQSV